MSVIKYRGKDGSIRVLSAIPGPQGPKGDKGEAGTSFKYEDFTQAQLDSLKGPKGDDGSQGPKGDSPVKGVDYWNESDKLEVKEFIDEAVVDKASITNTSNLIDNSLPGISGYIVPLELDIDTLPEVPKTLTGSDRNTLYPKVIEVKPNTEYTLPVGFMGNVGMYRADGSRAKAPNQDGMNQTNKGCTFTTTKDTKYLAVHHHFLSTFKYSELTLAEGTDSFVGKKIISDIKIAGDQVIGLPELTDEVVCVKDKISSFDTDYLKARPNLFDKNIGFIDGQAPYTILTYTDDSGQVNIVDLETEDLSPLYNSENIRNYKLYKKAIKLEPNTTYCYDKDYSGLVMKIVISSDYKDIINAGYNVDKPEYIVGCRESVMENGWIEFTTPNTLDCYYLILALWKGTDTDLSKFTIINADSIRYHEILDSAQDNKDNIDSVRAYSHYDNLYDYASKIQDVQTPSSLTIALMADTHYCDTLANARDKLRTANTMGLLSNYVNVDLMANLGDFLAGNEPKSETRNDLAQLIVNTNQNAKCPVLYVRGNHDDNGWYSYQYDEYIKNHAKWEADRAEGKTVGPEPGVPEQYGTYRKTEIINDTEWYSMATAFARNDIVVDDAKPYGGYGYYDHEASKIRVFMLNNCDIPYIEETEDYDLTEIYEGYNSKYGGYRYNSYQAFAFSNEQLNFVANALKFEDKDKPDDWAALFLVHVPIDTTNDAGKRFGAPDALIRGHEQMLEIIKAYRTGSSYSFSGSVSYADQPNSGFNEKAEDFMVDLNIDYSNKGTGDVIAFFNGHTHSDNFSRTVGYEDSLSYGYTFMGFWGAVDFATVVINRDKRAEWIKGYQAPVSINTSSTLPPLNNPAPEGKEANYTLFNNIIKLESNTTYSVPSWFQGQIRIYSANGTAGKLFTHDNNSFTQPEGQDIYTFTTAGSTSWAYACISLWRCDDKKEDLQLYKHTDNSVEAVLSLGSEYTGNGSISAFKYGRVTPETFGGTVACDPEELKDGQWVVEFDQFRG